MSLYEVINHILHPKAVMAGEYEIEQTIPERDLPHSAHECYVSGYFFNDAAKVEPCLRKGLQLNMVREYLNAVNPNAIAIYFKDKKLGYVSHDISTELAAQMDKGKRFMATIKDFNPNEQPWSRLYISIA